MNNIPFYIKHADGEWTDEEKLLIFGKLLVSLRAAPCPVLVTLNEGADDNPVAISHEFVDASE